MAVAERWNPWAALRRRPEVTFVRAPLPKSTAGAVCARWSDGTAVIAIDPSLTYAERQAALTHELVHLERDGSGAYEGQPDGWAAVVAREEGRVERIAARLIVPPDELRQFVDRRTASDLVTTAIDVAEEFETTEQMAELSMLLMKGEVA